MIQQILAHTPLFVWVLLAALTAMGLAQTRDRTVSTPRALLPALAFVLWSLSGVVLGFHAQWLAGSAAWAVGISLAQLLNLALRFPRGARYLGPGQGYALRGSWLPLGVILTLFVFKYGVGVALAISPALGQRPGFVVPASLLFGLCSGLFVAGALRLFRMRQQAAPQGEAVCLALS